MVRWNRILLKLSGEMLAGPSRFGLDEEAIAAVAQELVLAQQLEVGIGVVLEAGNLFRGAGPNRSPLTIRQQNKDSMGMLATAINATALQDRLDRAGVEALHVSTLESVPNARRFHLAEVEGVMARGGIVIFSGGTGLPFFSTDTGAAVRALQISAAALVKGTQVDGVFDRDPNKAGDGPAPVFFPQLTIRQALEKQLAFMDLAALALCQQQGMDIVVYNAHGTGNLRRVLEGAMTCSLVQAR